MRRLSSHLLLTPRGLESGKVVTVSDQGVVTDVSTPPHLDREAGVEFFSGILMPAFRNAHCHLELSHLRDAIPTGAGLTGFARGMRTVRSEELRVKSEEFEKDAAADLWDARMWSEGVSVVSDICNGPETFELKRRSRIKYHNFCELFGLGANPAKAFTLRDEARAAGLEASVTPHSLYSLNCENFAASIRPDYSIPRSPTLHSSPITLHFLESEDEVELYKRKGPLWDWYVEQGLKPDFLDYGSPSERLVAQIPPDREIMLVHNCCVAQRDIDIVMGHFTAPVTWVVCPSSNLHIGGLTPPVDLLRKNKLKIAVGTDSLASNDTLSVVRELSLIKNVPLAELLSLAAADTVTPGHSPGLVLLTGVDLEKKSLTAAAVSQRII